MRGGLNSVLWQSEPSKWISPFLSILSARRLVFGFMKIAKAYQGSDGKVYVKFPNEFAKSMVEQARLRDSIRAAVNVVAGKSIGDGELELCVADGKEKISDLDEFEI